MVGVRAEFELDEIAAEVLPGLRLLPVVHARVDMGGLTRAVLDVTDPPMVAIELPTTMLKVVLQAVARLPKISVVLTEEDDADWPPLIWLITPGDPFVEAIRWAVERGRAVLFIDPDLRYTERTNDLVPDPYAMWQIGPAAYLSFVRQALDQTEVLPIDLQREAGMAFYLQRALRSLDHDRKPDLSAAAPVQIVAIVGAAHASRLAENLQEPSALPMGRPRRSRIEIRHLHPDSMSGIFEDVPLAHAVYELLRDGQVPTAVHETATYSTKVSLESHGLRLVSAEPASQQQTRSMQLARFAAAQAHAKRVDDRPLVNRPSLSSVVWRVAVGSYREQTQEVVRPWQHRLFFDYLRRYCRIQGRLTPGLFEWVVAARGVADDNLAWEVFDAARTYPWQTEEAEIPVARIDGEMLDLGTRKVRFRRRFFKIKRRLVRVPVVERPATQDPATWLDGFTDPFGRRLGLCSYPPEDLIVEDYGRYLQAKAISVVNAERTRTEPFSTSLLDGIDIRETLRNVHENRIYVKEQGRVPGSAGSVVVIFDRDLDGDRYPYHMTWQGEHDEESDMAFYATSPAEQVVGPGITRTTYGGFMMSMPPGRVFNVWGDADYQRVQEKSDVLIMAAVDYSEGRHVVHVAAAPPNERMRSYAARSCKRLVHIPLGTLSPVTLKKIRVVHLLAGSDKRDIAKGYIW